MARVYLETSFFSACVSMRTSPRSIVWRETSLDWWRNEATHHELHISAEVIAELSDPFYAERGTALAMIKGLNALELSDDVGGFAEILVREKVMPSPAISGDAVHVATATIYQMDYLLSWNVQHLANPRKRQHFAVICLRAGLVPPQIVTPDILME